MRVCLTLWPSGAGSVAFANVVKAAEPFAAVLMGVIMARTVPPVSELLALIPIIAGVMIASMAEVRACTILEPPYQCRKYLHDESNRIDFRQQTEEKK